MTGYLDDPARNAEATGGGFYHTGDVASVDDDGYITYVGRADDVFKASDYRISPFELESVLIEHPAVAEAAVVPSPDPVRLAVPKAFVMLAPGLRRRQGAGVRHPEVRPRAPGAVQADPAARVHRPAEDDLAARSAGSSCARPRRSMAAASTGRDSYSEPTSPSSSPDRVAGFVSRRSTSATPQLFVASAARPGDATLHGHPRTGATGARSLAAGRAGCRRLCRTSGYGSSSRRRRDAVTSRTPSGRWHRHAHRCALGHDRRAWPATTAAASSRCAALDYPDESARLAVARRRPDRRASRTLRRPLRSHGGTGLLPSRTSPSRPSADPTPGTTPRARGSTCAEASASLERRPDPRRSRAPLARTSVDGRSRQAARAVGTMHLHPC